MGDKVVAKPPEAGTPASEAWIREQKQAAVVLEWMAKQGLFRSVGNPLTGYELELCITDERTAPLLINGDESLEAEYQNAAAGVTKELGRWNIEDNGGRPLALRGEGAAEIKRVMHERSDYVRKIVHDANPDAHVISIGILPTLTPEHLTRAALSNEVRYDVLNDRIVEARHGGIRVKISGGPGRERINIKVDSIAVEAFATSQQFHHDTSVEDYPHVHNAAQLISGLQLCLAANSPYFLGQELNRETRIKVFERATDTRDFRQRVGGRQPRVLFGDSWATSFADLWAENAELHPEPLLVKVADGVDGSGVTHADAALAIADVDAAEREDLMAGRTRDAPQLIAGQLLNGTMWRWNRPIYDFTEIAAPSEDGTTTENVRAAFLRVENRVVPAGPTTIDMWADRLFFHGAVTALTDQFKNSNISSWYDFSFVKQAFEACARDGINAKITWPMDSNFRPAQQLTEHAAMWEFDAVDVLREAVLPLARQGLEMLEVDAPEIDEAMGILQARCDNRMNGAEWQVTVVHAIEQFSEDQELGLSRSDALEAMTAMYAVRQEANRPVGHWKSPFLKDSEFLKADQQIMTRVIESAKARKAAGIEPTSTITAAGRLRMAPAAVASPDQRPRLPQSAPGASRENTASRS